MAYSVKILADSVNPVGCRLTTFELTYPRCIHAELLTHRMFSRNSASSRAIPVEKLIQRVIDDPFIPIRWGRAQKGMVSGDDLDTLERDVAVKTWLNVRDLAVAAARSLVAIGCHKTLPNRLIEPWMWITVILSATEFGNFWTLRVSPQAEDHFRHLATLMQVEYRRCEPKQVRAGEWHLPLLFDDGALGPESARKLSTARCARVSYLTHDGTRDPQADFDLHDRLLADKHLSPFEHPAMALGSTDMVANFRGWVQYRRMVAGGM